MQVLTHVHPTVEGGHLPVLDKDMLMVTNSIITPPSGRSLVTPIFFFGGGHLPQTSGFYSAKQILVVSFATQVRARILSGHNIFYTLGEGQQRQGIMPQGFFLL